MINLCLARSLRIGALFICIALSGCGEPPKPAGELAGTVFSNDEPVDGCVLTLFNTATKRIIGGRSGLKGEFVIKDIPLGDYEIAISQKPSNEAVDPPFDKRIPSQYRRRSTSGFSVKIVDGENSMDLKMAR